MSRRLIAVTILVATFCPRHLPAQNAPPDPFAAGRQARQEGRFGMLLRQFRADEPALGEHHEAGRKPATPLYQGAGDVPAGYWVWQAPYWFVFRDGPDHGIVPRPWGSEAACHAPDTAEPGDHGTAWAAEEEDGKDDWLLLEYATPVRATSLEVHESCNPGAIATVAILLPNGEEIEVWRNREIRPVTESGRVLHVDLPLGFEVERVKLRLASNAVAGRNEIDAVGLRDVKGKLHWAARCESNSTRADSPQPAAVQLRFGFQQQIGAEQVLQLQHLNLLAPMQPVPLQPLRLHIVSAPQLWPWRQNAVLRALPDAPDKAK